MTAAAHAESFQLPIEAAETYEAAFVPAFFAQWAPLLCSAARVAPGHRVLDVACGTGIVARTAAELARGGPVVGLDLNEAMLRVARRVGPDIEWRQGAAEVLPFADCSFDVVLCQMALMFFRHRGAALAEMARVVDEGGMVAIAVPGRLDRQAAFAPFVAMVGRHAGPEAMALLGAYFVCSDLDELSAQIESAGLEVTSRAIHTGTYRAPSVDGFVTIEVESTPLFERLSAEDYQRIRDGAHEVLRPFTGADGRVEAPFETNIVAARRR